MYEAGDSRELNQALDTAVTRLRTHAEPRAVVARPCRRSAADSISCVKRFWCTSNAIVGLFGLTQMPKSYQGTPIVGMA